jgi:hypothetical protein
MGGIECYWWKFWRRLRALTEQLPRPVALAGAFEVPTGGTALISGIPLQAGQISEAFVVLSLQGRPYNICPGYHWALRRERPCASGIVQWEAPSTSGSHDLRRVPPIEQCPWHRASPFTKPLGLLSSGQCPGRYLGGRKRGRSCDISSK